MNRALIGPIVAILYLVCHDIFGWDVTQGALQTTVDTVILIISGIMALVGVFTHPKQPPNN